MAHRRVGERSLTHLPALAEIARDAHPLVVVMKSAQVGLTELEVNLALHAADTGYAGRGNVLFLMPNQNQMDDFARSRFDRAIQDSAYLRERLQPEPPRRKGADSMRLKRVGDGYIYLRGADSQRQIASVDADLVILDEFDQMGEGVLELAEKRIASSRAGRIVVARPDAALRLRPAWKRWSTRFSDSADRYLLPCPSCRPESRRSAGRRTSTRSARSSAARTTASRWTWRVQGRTLAEAPGNAHDPRLSPEPAVQPVVRHQGDDRCQRVADPSRSRRRSATPICSARSFVAAAGGSTLDGLRSGTSRSTPSRSTPVSAGPWVWTSGSSGDVVI